MTRPFAFLALCLSTSLSAAVITVSSTESRMRFASPGPTAQIRVQILLANGDALFDSAWKDGNVLDWPSGRLADGTYHCVVLVKDLEGNVTEKESELIARDGRVAVEERPE